jgi:A/G-specific adenine glycosylase
MSELSHRLLEWYSHQGRELIWQGNPPDPYEVWVAVVMLQQTRLDTVIPYLERWLKRFPTLSKLARASEQAALSAWEGLGYYNRARNLYKAAKVIMKDYQGKLPSDLEALRRLPGIGRYSAGAIASIAFGVDSPAVDGNVKRVFARIFNISELVDSATGEAVLWSLVEDNLPPGHAGEYNQALMDLGATVCLPRNPACLLCPLSDLCQARQLGLQDQRPIMKPKLKVPHYIVTAAILLRDGKVLLAKRPSMGLLGGMWEFPGGKTEPQETLQNCLVREIKEELGIKIKVGEPFGVYRHAYTHFQITLHAFLCDVVAGEPRPLEAAELAWVPLSDLHAYPMGKVDRLIARHLQ